jgi:hypothetical protein
MMTSATRAGSIGAYAFVTEDWKEKDYPFDIWLGHSLELFDQVAIVSYGDVLVPTHSRLILRRTAPVNESSFEFYVRGKEDAQRLLTTHWKVLLDIDEFLKERIDTSELDERYAYPLRYHNLYGNLFTEIIYENSLRYQFRIHTGFRPMIGDGGNVKPPYPGFVNVIKALALTLFYVERRSKTVLGSLGASAGRDASQFRSLFQKAITEAYAFSYTRDAFRLCFDVYHTNTVRRPEALEKKWLEQMRREAKETEFHNAKHLAFLQESGFDYRLFLRSLSNVKLMRVEPDELPSILVENSDRFNQATL